MMKENTAKKRLFYFAIFNYCLLLGANLWAKDILPKKAKCPGKTFVVTTTTDTLPTGTPGQLRWAIQQSNNNPPPAGSVNTINFNISGTGPFTISPAADLDPITAPVLINGYSQPGAVSNTDPLISNAVLQIQISGSNYTVGDGEITGNGLNFQAGSDGSIVRGICLSQWLLAGISITAATGIQILGNFIGTDITGTTQQANQAGILTSGANGLSVGSGNPADRNLIAGSFGYFSQGGCIAIKGDVNDTIKGNLIGTDATGTIVLGNSQVAIDLATSSHITIGGGDSSSRNVISGHIYGVRVSASSNCTIQSNYIGTDVTGSSVLGNKNAGVVIHGDGTPNSGSNNQIISNVVSGNGSGMFIGQARRVGATQNLVIGNLVGTDATGTKSLGNARYGIMIDDNDNTIGGCNSAQRNIIANNGLDGILVYASQGNTITGNYIGTDITGTVAMPNGTGIQVGLPGGFGAATNTVIGGSNGCQGNLISGNTNDGILVKSFSTGTIIQGNLIGTDASGTQPLPNGGNGIEFVCAGSNLVGGDSTFAGNTIAFNTDGVLVGRDAKDTTSVNNSILTNSIFANTHLGIDLHANPNKCVAGPNNFQAAPILATAAQAGNALTVTGTLKSVPSSSFLIQLFATPNNAAGQGQFFLGETVVTTNAVGCGSFSTSVTNTTGGEFITATATLLSGTTSLNTSQFSKPILATA